MNLFKKKFSLLEKKNFKFCYFKLNRKRFSDVSQANQENSKHNLDAQESIKTSSNVRMTSQFKLRPEDIDDYIIIGSEIFKNAFKESVLIAEKEPDIIKRTEILIRELDQKQEIYGNMNFDFKFPQPKEK